MSAQVLAKTHPWLSGRNILLPILIAVLLVLALFQTLGQSLRHATSTMKPVYSPGIGNLPLHFEPNAGQTDPSVRFMAHASSGVLYFAPTEVVLSLKAGTAGVAGVEDQASWAGVANRPGHRLLSGTRPSSLDNAQPSYNTVHMQFVGANTSVELEEGPILPGKVNYLRGNNTSEWHTDIPTYSDIIYTGLYPGVDLTYNGTRGQLKGTYTIAPGADPANIRWRYIGADKVAVDNTGNLQITINNSALTEEAPVAWQDIDGKRVAVSARYEIAAGGAFGFVLGSYDRQRPLTLDPALVYSSYLGGGGEDNGWAIATDTEGNIYVVGRTASGNFPTRLPFQPSYGGGSYDAFVTKLNATGSDLVYSTYLGGSGSDSAEAIVVDQVGNAYIVGGTFSTNFPTQNPIQPCYGGNGFITKLNDRGSGLLYSTCLGGTNSADGAIDIVVDQAGNAYVSGYAMSTDFPTTPGAFQPNNAGGIGSADGFVAKLNAAGSALIYSTYLGGTGSDEGALSIAIDASGNAYVAGQTNSTDFPTHDPFQPDYAGGSWDGFVAKLNGDGSDLVYSTYLGGYLLDFPFSIAVDTAGNAYVGGDTQSPNFPTQNPFQPNIAGGVDVFVTKLNPAGSGLIYSTFLGGGSTDSNQDMAVDGAGNLYITGYTASSNFPVVNAIQPTRAGGRDIYVTKLNPAGSGLVYSTFLGSTSLDEGYGIAIDGIGNTYVTGQTLSSSGFPTRNPYQPQSGGFYDAFAAKIAESGIVNGHLTWEGIPQPDTRNQGLTATLTLCSGNSTAYTSQITTDQNGNFALTTGLPDGSYSWKVKGRKQLANGDTLTMSGGVTSQEFGLQRGGDCDNNNVDNTTDFNILKDTFGKSVGQPGYDERADFDNNNIVNSLDFIVQRNNFGQAGVALTCP